MTVYVAIQQGWEHAAILGVFSNRDAAVQRCIVAEKEDGSEAYVVESHALDATVYVTLREVISTGDIPKARAEWRQY